MTGLFKMISKVKNYGIVAYDKIQNEIDIDLKPMDGHISSLQKI